MNVLYFITYIWAHHRKGANVMIIKYVNKQVRYGYYHSVGGASTGPPPQVSIQEVE